MERIVNDLIRQDLQRDENREASMDEAHEMGAIALFGEKYGDKVRVIRFGPSCELCGGIHATSTGRIGLFKILSESSVAAGVRRIEAITGKRCEDRIYIMEDTLKALRSLFNNAKDLQGVIQKYIDEHDSMKKEIEQFQAQNVERIRKDLVTHVEKVNGFNVVKAVLPIQANVAKDLVFKIREQIPEKLLCVIGSTAQDKPLLTVILSEDMVKEYGFNAGQIVREAAKLIKGGGGGQPHFASAGGKDLEGIHAAVDAVINSIK